MTTPTREQVVQWAKDCVTTDLASPVHERTDGNLEFGIFHEEEMMQFATLARADLEATSAEQAAEIELLKNFWSIEGANVDRLRQQNAELKNWKQQATTVLNETDLQEIGKVIGVGIGDSVGPRILPAINELTAQRKALKDAAEYNKSRADYAEKQRDELLSALENIAACPGDNRLSTAIQWAKNAIAKCK